MTIKELYHYMTTASEEQNDQAIEVLSEIMHEIQNMMYSDYYKPTRTVDTYASLAKDFLKDVDAPADKLKRYIDAMA